MIQATFYRIARTSAVILLALASVALQAQTSPSVAFIPLDFTEGDTTLEILAGTAGDSLAITLQAVGVSMRYPDNADSGDIDDLCAEYKTDYGLFGSVTKGEGAYRIEISLYSAGTRKTPIFSREIEQVLDVYDASDDLYLSVASEISAVSVEDIRLAVLRRQEAAESGLADAPKLPIPRAGLAFEFLFDNDKKDTSGKKELLTGKPRFETDRYGKTNAALKVLKFASVEYKIDSRVALFDDFTVSVWIKPNPGTYLDNGRILDCGDSIGTRGFGLSCIMGGKLAFLYESKKQLVRVETRQKLAAQTWYNVVVTHAKGVTKLYVNGVLEGSDESGLPIMGYREARYVIGMSGNGRYAYNGAIDDLRVYKRVLTEREIQTLQQ